MVLFVIEQVYGIVWLERKRGVRTVRNEMGGPIAISSAYGWIPIAMVDSYHVSLL